jgi:polyisoprenoid-binding protein YceI
MRNRMFAVALATLAISAPAIAADTFTVDKAHSEVTFRVRHLGISNVSGRFTDFDGAVQIDQAKPEASSVEFTIQTASVNTSNEGRDKHLRSADFFDAEKFPTISFKSSKVAAAGKDRYNVTGSFTMRGVTKEVTLPVAVLGFGKGMRGEDRAAFEIQTVVNRQDYGVNWNRTLDTGGVVVSDEVNVLINVEAVKKAPAPATN